jgi:DNA polymerase elongation subunit (family B)/endogenous inhibitor of DNA gyrase (YacG/DUF329 family)
VKLLFIDIENAPNMATVWGIYNQNISINQLLETSRVLCFTAQWHGEEHAYFMSEYEHTHEGMINALWDFLNEADAVIHYNGKKFDMPVINREFLKYGLTPPSPYKQIDLMLTVKKQFRFVSNKLDHVCDELGIGRKVSHEGHELWLKCMDGQPAAWKKMEEYNIQDVALLEELYEKLKPWITDHPNLAMYADERTEISCPNCGSHNIQKRGLAHTTTYSYQRYQCQDCGTWSRERRNIRSADENRKVITQVKS